VWEVRKVGKFVKTELGIAVKKKKREAITAVDWIIKGATSLLEFM